jgi:hypothetical protein
MSLLDRFAWRCSVCTARTSKKHTRCKACGAVREDVSPFPRPSEIDSETTGDSVA